MSVSKLTRRLVATPSHEDATAAGDLIVEWLDDHTDAAVSRDDAGNVVARRNSGADTSLALVGHHDVVPPDATQTDDGGEYAVEERDGRLYGRGAADMKGSLAAAMVAFRDADPDCELVFASFTGEESGGVGCRAAIEAGFAPDYAVVGEGSTGYSAAGVAGSNAKGGSSERRSDGVTDVAIAHKRRRAATVRADGVAAHASEADAGENAIYRGVDAVDAVRGLPTPATEVLGRRLEGSLAVTEIEGGHAWNVVPKRCEITVDERTVPGERAPLASVETIEGASVSVEQDLPPMACEDPAFAETALSAAASQPDAPRQVVKPPATDAGWPAARAGPDCLVCGAAEPGAAHAADESVSIPVVRRCADIYRQIATSVE